MDAKHFDTLTRALSEAGTRRGLLGLLATLPVLGGLFALLVPGESDAKGRRRRRKKAHKHGKGRHKHKKHKKTCKAHSTAKTCAGTCGQVKNNCKKTVDCGPCDCDPSCGSCETCTDALVCEPCDPCCNDVCCTQAKAICHADTGACCVPASKAQACNGQCGDVTNNCGLTVDCGPCTCGGGCPTCRVCDEESGACVPDLNQQGDTCGDCRLCDDGQCSGCPDCCDAAGDCQDGDTPAACGSSGTCDVCTGQEQCQNQTCVCVPDCTGKVCGPDGCGDQCEPGCLPNSTCSGDGTSCPCDFVTCDSTCCVQDESCCGTECVDLQTDPEHCGDCATACTGSAVCQDGSCGVVCGAGFCAASGPTPDCCGTTCTNTDSDPDNCGACGTTCPGDQVCQGGVCGVICGSDFCPAAFEICVDGTCQSCNVTCPGGTCTGTDLQTALDGGGTVTVCPGRYTGNFTFFDADVTVIGAGQGTDETVDTILDAQQSGRVVTIADDHTVALRQLRITGGRRLDSSGAAGVGNGGRLLTMTDCTVSHNQTNGSSSFDTFGAIVNGNRSRLEMTGCTIHDNAATNPEASVGAVGGGIVNLSIFQLVLTDCVIRNNSAETAGGGLYNFQGPATLTGCEIHDNAVTNPGYGGGIHVEDGSVTLTDSFVWDNTPPDCAGNVIGMGCGVEPPPD